MGNTETTDDKVEGLSPEKLNHHSAAEKEGSRYIQGRDVQKS